MENSLQSCMQDNEIRQDNAELFLPGRPPKAPSTRAKFGRQNWTTVGIPNLLHLREYIQRVDKSDRQAP